LLNKSRAALETMMEWPSYAGLSDNQILQYLQNFYANLLQNYFSNVQVSVKTDEIYRKYNPEPFPYYYIEITGIKIPPQQSSSMDLSGMMGGLSGTGGLSSLGGLASSLPGGVGGLSGLGGLLGGGSGTAPASSTKPATSAGKASSAGGLGSSLGLPF
jgi:hypothetical protein